MTTIDLGTRVPIQSVSEGFFEVTDLVPAITLHLESTTGDYTAHDQPITILGGQTLSLPSVTLNRARGNLVGFDFRRRNQSQWGECVAFKQRAPISRSEQWAIDLFIGYPTGVTNSL